MPKERMFAKAMTVTRHLAMPICRGRLLAAQKFRSRGLVLLVLWGLWLPAVSPVAATEGLALFEMQVQPILAEHCYPCHSHDADKIKGGLLLDSHEAALKGGDSGPALVPGKPEESLFIKAIRYTDPKEIQAIMNKPASERTVLLDWLTGYVVEHLLEVFDPPDAYTSTPQRNVTTTPSQALQLINGQYTLQRAQALAARIAQSKPADDWHTVAAAYRCVVGRHPLKSEQAAAVSFLDEQARRIAASDAKDVSTSTESMPRRNGSTAALFRRTGSQTRLQVPDNIKSEMAPSSRLDAKTAALIDFCHLLFNANEFLYVD